jgi:hypothetical protein
VKLDNSCLFCTVFSAADSIIVVVLYCSVRLEGRFVQDLLGPQRIDEDDDWWEVFAVWRHDARITGQILNFVFFFVAFARSRPLAVMEMEIEEAIPMGGL